ncbi:TetR/AcrR family transcriptional regulator [Roseovarius sp.]|uniref:TetR/AcrR family transcriptional regulator n=1 Tax=Roseovarius sp. TaxID=1486281 RepID=UPI003A975C3D
MAEPMSAIRRPRLTQDDWLLAGFEALCEAGPGALGAEPLARRLGATKGSFYWHFVDVPAYHRALLAMWQADAATALDAASEAGTDTAQLRDTVQRIAATAQGDRLALRAESAIRAWAGGDSLAAEAVRAVDDMRLKRLHRLLSACDIGNAEMARILYASAIGMQAMRDPAQDQAAPAIGSLVDLILALR